MLARVVLADVVSGGLRCRGVPLGLTCSFFAICGFGFCASMRSTAGSKRADKNCAQNNQDYMYEIMSLFHSFGFWAANIQFFLNLNF